LTPPDPSAYYLPDIVKALQTGNLAMALAWNSQGEAFATPEQTDYPIPEKMGFSVVPHHPSGGIHAPRIWPALWALAVSADSKHQEEAFQYITWFTSKETAMEVLMNGGGVSGRRSLLEDPEVLKDRPIMTSGADGMASWYTYPPIFENFDLLHKYLPSYTSKIMTTDFSKAAIKAVMEEAATAVEQFLRDHNYK